MSKPSDDPRVSPSHTEAIGRLVVAISKLDILLTDLTAVFLRTDIFSTVAAVHHQQVANKIDTLRTLVKLRRWPDGEPEILALLSKVKDVNEYRNRIVHGHWVVDKAAGKTYVVQYKTRGEFKRPRQAVTRQEILLRAQEADALADELGALRDRLWNLNGTQKLIDARNTEKARRRLERFMSSQHR
jgi:hypothetical protein